MSKLPKGVEKMPKGVGIHGDSIRINFTFKGVRCFEVLSDITKINKSSIKYAEQFLNVIRTEIKQGTFDYASRFPRSQKARQFSGWGGGQTKRTVKASIDSFLAVSEATNAATTHKSYKHKSAHVLAYFGGTRLLDSITSSDLKLFRAHLLKSKDEGGKGLASKTVNDVFTVVRSIMGDAFNDGAIKFNPADRLTNFKQPSKSEQADPYTRDELERIENSSKIRASIKNYILFGSWSGLSVSELMGLAWEDVDLVFKLAAVKRARVNEQYRVPKEQIRDRVIELIEPAVFWLQKQKAHTYMLSPVELAIVQRDNTKIEKVSVRPVFINELTGEPWTQAAIARQIADALRLEGIRHRSPNQCRHTFASQCLSNYVQLEWVARQLGHSDTAMIKKHYGRWIPEDAKRMGDEVSLKLGFSGDMTGQKAPKNVTKTCQGGLKSV